ncbi:hypothetical protein BST61_g10664 [Cercospora zeina]
MPSKDKCRSNNISNQSGRAIRHPDSIFFKVCTPEAKSQRIGFLERAKCRDIDLPLWLRNSSRYPTIDKIAVVASALTTGGPPGLFYNYIISFLGTLALAASMAEMASM